MLKRLNHVQLLTRMLAVALFIGMLGAFKPVIFNGGGSMAKYIAKQSQLGMVAEEQVEDYFEAVLYGEGEGEVAAAAVGTVPEPECRRHIETIFQIDRGVVYLLGLACLLLLFPRWLEPKAAQAILPILSLWLIAEAIGATLNGGKAYAELTIVAHATRWGMPLVLWGMVRKQRGGVSAIGRSSWLTHLAVVCTAATFATHGWEAWALNPFFQDLIHSFAGQYHLHVSPAVAAAHLKAIGAMDILLAATILVHRRPGLFLWMAIWGLITALSRPVAMGWEVWPEAAMRVANLALPLLLFLIYRQPESPALESSTCANPTAHESP